MALNFPNAPFEGQVYVSPSDVVYVWKTNGWYVQGGVSGGGSSPELVALIASNTDRIVLLEGRVATLEGILGTVDPSQGYIMPGYVEPGYFAGVTG